MYITRALIGQNPCLDQAIQTRKFKVKVFLKWNFNTESCYFHVPRFRAFGSWFRALFLTLATFPRVWIRPSKHGNHKLYIPKQAFTQADIQPYYRMDANFWIYSIDGHFCLLNLDGHILMDGHGRAKKMFSIQQLISFGIFLEYLNNIVSWPFFCWICWITSVWQFHVHVHENKLPRYFMDGQFWHSVWLKACSEEIKIWPFFKTETRYIPGFSHTM